MRRRHAALSLWLNAGGDPAQIAAGAGHSAAVLLTVHSDCIHRHDDFLNQQIGHVLGRYLIRPMAGPHRPSSTVRGTADSGRESR